MTIRTRVALAGQTRAREGRKSRAPAVNRAIAILRLLTDTGTPMGVNTIAREVGIVPSTCYHILHALEGEGLLALDQVDKRFSIGLGLVSLARGALDQNLSVRLFQADLDVIAGEFAATTVLVQLDNHEHMVILARNQALRDFRVNLEVGRRFPAFISATGRCNAAYSKLSRQELRRRFDKLIWEDPPKFDDWLKQIEAAYRNGIGVDRSNYVKGYVIYAAPVFENGQMRRAISAVFAQGQLDKKKEQTLAKRLLSSGKRLST